ncbi:MAG: VWA domain-containing protein [Thermomonas sp.]|uniref:vWA domain-containing protein n=1 Tax=Thermomonas sp. TaxID=1971895 RepID=UPI001DD7DEB0|nr:VWA domain-containing protein [Thermomonas sp.]MBZ0088252.1 VWA domain-containing protein [Thermomonas sp.]
MNLLPQALAFDGFAWPWLLAAAILPLLAWWLLPAGASRDPALRAPWVQRLPEVAAGTRGRSAARRFPWLLLCAWLLLCVAAARPQRLGPPVAPPQVGRDLMLGLDLSASMSEEDMELGGRSVDRLTAAKAVLADFLDRREGDRIGLIVFGDRAYALTPLTLDRNSVRQQLDDTWLGLAGRATALGDAIGLATKRLQAQPVGQRVLILLTDGVSNTGVLDPQRAARIASDAGVRIYTIAFGGSGSAVSLFGFRFALGGGEEVDESGLRKIADLTGGRFYRARATDELAGIYSEINRLEPIKRAGLPQRPKIELYPWPLGFALGLGLLALALRGRGP